MEKRKKKKVLAGSETRDGRPRRLFGYITVSCVRADLQDGDVPAEALQRSRYLATFQPLLRRQTRQPLVKLHGWKTDQNDTKRHQGRFSFKKNPKHSCQKKNSLTCWMECFINQRVLFYAPVAEENH